MLCNVWLGRFFCTLQVKAIHGPGWLGVALDEIESHLYLNDLNYERYEQLYFLGDVLRCVATSLSFSSRLQGLPVSHE